VVVIVDSSDGARSASSSWSSSSFVPVVGIYGVYDLPTSGPHAVLVTETEGAYALPLPAGRRITGKSRPLLELRRVKCLEIILLRRRKVYSSLADDDADNEGSLN